MPDFDPCPCDITRERNASIYRALSLTKLAVRSITTMASSPFSLSNVFDLKGRIAVITGGGTGIGWMIAQGFATNGAKGMLAVQQLFLLPRVTDHRGMLCDYVSLHHWPA